MNKLTVLLAAGDVSLIGSASFAGKWNILDGNGVCEAADVTMGNAIDCRGIYGGPNNNANDSGIDLNNDLFETASGSLEDGLFTDPDDLYGDYGMWSSLLYKAETPFDGNTYYDVNGTEATLTLGSLVGYLNLYDQIVMAFKQGPQIGFYLFATPLDGGLEAFAYDLAKFTQRDSNLSHLSFYGRNCEDDAEDCGDPGTVVPLPAAGWLLLGGIGGLAALRRRKKA